MGTNSAPFQAFLIASQTARSIAPGLVRWTAWMDPGVHTGFAMVTYARSPASEALFDDGMKRVGICGWHGVPGVVKRPDGEGLFDVCSAAILSIHTELLTDHEPQQVRTAIARVRQLGAVFTGSSMWNLPLGAADEYTLDPHLGAAGVGAETFINLRPERSAEYLSPVRIRSMFQYALEDEFGVDMQGQMPGDAKNTFSDIRTKKLGLYIPGPDHVRDALAHALLAIRKHG